jgi:hypothetical protein
MTGWEVDPGEWSMTSGTQASLGEALPSADAPLKNAKTKIVAFERSKSIEVTFAPRTTTVIELTLKSKGVPYWSRPDLGIDPEDVKVDGQAVTVTVHSVGAVDTPASKVVVRDRTGKALAIADVPALKAPVDLVPKTAVVRMVLPKSAELKGGSVSVECGGNVPEITLMNNSVQM